MRLGPFNQSRKSAHSYARNVHKVASIFGCIPTQFRRPAEYRSKLINSDVICSRFQLTNSTHPKAQARSTFGGAYEYSGQNVGGHQERERRAGTEAVPGIVAFGAAVRLAREELDQRNANARELREKFEAAVAERISDVVFNGHPELRLTHISNISFRFIEGQSLLISLDLEGIAVSTGSACSSGTLEPSPVIRALGRNDELARGAIRFSFGKDNTAAEVDYVVDVLSRVTQKLRTLSPLNKVKVPSSEFGYERVDFITDERTTQLQNRKP